MRRPRRQRRHARRRLGAQLPAQTSSRPAEEAPEADAARTPDAAAEDADAPRHRLHYELDDARLPELSDPSAEDLLLRAAREAVGRGELDRARGIYGELLELSPGHVEAGHDLALLLERQGEAGEALRQIEECLTHDAGNPGLRATRGGLLGALGRFDEAEAELREALAEAGAHPELHLALGVVLARRALWRDAVPHLRRAIELDGGQAAAYFQLGEALNRLDDLDGALQAFQRAAELRPDSPRALRGLGIIYDRLNRPQEAAQMYRRSRELAGS